MEFLRAGELVADMREGFLLGMRAFPPGAQGKETLVPD